MQNKKPYIYREIEKRLTHQLSERLLDRDAIFQEKGIVLRVRTRSMTMDDWGVKLMLDVVATDGLDVHTPPIAVSGAWEALSIDDRTISAAYGGWHLYSDEMLLKAVVAFAEQDQRNRDRYHELDNIISEREQARRSEITRHFIHQYELFARTETGLKPDRNEDHILILDSIHNQDQHHRQTKETSTFVQQHEALCTAVADGVGGQTGGDKASRLTLEFLLEYVYLRQWVKDAQGLLLELALNDINKRIRALQQRSEYPSAMGTTLCGLLLIPDGTWAFHAGDSRLYHYRATGAELDLLTIDDARPGLIAQKAEMSLQEAVESGSATLTNCIGIEAFIPHVFKLPPLEHSDTLLLCTDGLYSEVSRKYIRDVLASDHLSLTDKGDRLFQAAIDAGGHDNISLILIQVM